VIRGEQLLRALEPGARAWPFTPVDEQFRLFRAPGSPIPVPAYSEYVEGLVPAFFADAEVVERLDRFGWAFMEGPPSAGKTTLAMRLATKTRQHGNPAYYLDLGEEHGEEEDAFAALMRLSRPGTLLILDNIHREPNLANKAWDLWRDLRRHDSKLILIATRLDPEEMLPPQEDTTRLKTHRENPAIYIRPSDEDLGAIAQHLHIRVSGGRKILPPPQALKQWWQTFGGQLHTFCPAVLGSLHGFRRGDWSLLMEAALLWVREYWLRKLDDPSLENLLCLSAFGAQDLELTVQKDALPNPGAMDQLRRLGLLVRTNHGLFGQYQRFCLVEHSWGDLILRAHSSVVDPEVIRFDAAIRHPMMALALSVRLRSNRETGRGERLWAAVAKKPGALLSQVVNIDLQFFQYLISEARPFDAHLTNKLWEAIEKEPDKLAARAWETPLHLLASFLETAKRHERDVAPLWEAIEKEPDTLVARAWEMPLEYVASFLNTAKDHGRDVGPLWEAVEKEPDKLAARAWETPLDKVASFLRAAKDHGRDVRPLWEAIEKQPDKLAAAAWETPLGDLASFLDITKDHGRAVGPLWKAIEKEPDKLAARAWEKETHLDKVASFLRAAKDHKRDVGPLWEAFEKEPDKLAAAAWETPLGDLASFLDIAKDHGRDVRPLWKAIEKEPDKLAKTHWTDLDKVAAWFHTVQRAERDPQLYVCAFCQDPRKLSDLAKRSPMGGLAGFVHAVPDEIVRIAFADITPRYWQNTPGREPLFGATWVAKRCKEIEREDLASALITLLLRRANWRDFPPRQSMSLFLIAWLLENVPPSERGLVPTFINALCTGSWLGSHYTNVEACGALANGLFTLGLSQTAEVCTHFHNASLGMRLVRQFQDFGHAAPGERCESIRLLGVAALCGWRANVGAIACASEQLVGTLPETALPHRPENVVIENRQYQLWLGLRTFVSIQRQPLALRRAVIEETFDRWTNNLSGSADHPTSARHRIDQSMTRWLEGCLQLGMPSLQPEPERLWELIGFPRYAS
jgi:hypothetical protein